MHSITIQLPYSGAYDWAAALRFFAARAVDGVEQVDGDLYRRTIRIGDSSGLLEVSPARSGSELQATLHLSSAADEAEITARLRRMFDLDADLALINAHLASDPLMARLVHGATGPSRVRWLGSLRSRDADDQRTAGLGRACASSEWRARGPLWRPATLRAQ